MTERNAERPPTPRTQSRRQGELWGLDRVRAVAKRDPTTRFTALLHHVNIDLLRRAFDGLNRKAAPGVDDVTWESYREDLESNLQDLLGRIHRGAYRPHPSKRRNIPKADGGQRPLGIAALEDKLAQKAVADVLNAIYEVDFRSFSYGFRPERNQHHALDALAYVVKCEKVNWLLDADIRAYFDTIDHDMLVRFIEQRIGDQRILRLIWKWLRAGVLDDGELLKTTVGTPQGSAISPLLANIYLHYVLDEWVVEWRSRSGTGEVYIVRYADDFIVGFQRSADARRFHTDLHARMQEHRLELHPDKTRLIEFGRFARQDRAKRGQGKPETFNFLGFTHICGQSKNGKFLLLRHTIAKRLRAKLADIKTKLRKQLHRDPSATGAWLQSVLNGYFQYHAVPSNGRVLDGFRTAVARLWLKALRRRSQKHRMHWGRFQPMVDQWLPRVRDRHPMPELRFKHTRLTRSRSPVR